MVKQKSTSMFQNVISALFERDLKALIKELKTYTSEEDIWSVFDGKINNSAGNLALHIIGNLNHFIGAQLGATGYNRQREKEFSEIGIPRETIINKLEETLELVKSVLPQVSNEQLEEIYPINVFDKEMTTMLFLTHLATHLAYHLGQINYHRRLLQ